MAQSYFDSSLSGQEIENALLASKKATSLTGIVKYDGQSGGTGSVSSAVAGVDYLAPSNIIKTAATLTVEEDDWTNHKQTVSVQGVTATSAVIATPAAASYVDYQTAQVRLISQSAGELTFECTTDPTAAIVVNLIII